MHSSRALPRPKAYGAARITTVASASGRLLLRVACSSGTPPTREPNTITHREIDYLTSCRCQMCPNAFCEEHLPGNASIVKTCQRFSLLGYKHAKTACYIICSAGCVATSKQQGVLEASRHVSAGGILGSAGVDLTNCLLRPQSNNCSPFQQKTIKKK